MWIEFDDMLNKPLKSVELRNNKEKITFSFVDGSERSFRADGDCCSLSWIEHLELPPNLEGAIITSVEESGGIPWDNHECKEPPEGEYQKPCGHDCLSVYNILFFTNKGTITLEFRNDSNGYYGGYLIDA